MIGYVEKNIMYFMFILFLICSSGTYSFVDTDSSFDEWYSIPNNGRFLKLNVCLHTDSCLLQKRSYYLTKFGSSVYKTKLFLAEVSEVKGIMNIFPLPVDSDSIDITYGNFFPAPNVLELGIRITSQYENNIGTYTIKSYRTYVSAKPIIDDGSELIWVKKIVIDFNTKNGVLSDFSGDLDSKIWF